eukprot:12875549-Alexandrium_andersonii.AAC.1
MRQLNLGRARKKARAGTTTARISSVTSAQTPTPGWTRLHLHFAKGPSGPLQGRKPARSR